MPWQHVRTPEEHQAFAGSLGHEPEDAPHNEEPGRDLLGGRKDRAPYQPSCCVQNFKNSEALRDV